MKKDQMLSGVAALLAGLLIFTLAVVYTGKNDSASMMDSGTPTGTMSYRMMNGNMMNANSPNGAGREHMMGGMMGNKMMHGNQPDHSNCDAYQCRGD